MVCIHGSVRRESAARLRQQRRDKELAAMFGRGLMEKARETDPMALDLTAERMESVHEAADQLLAKAGDTLGQRRTVARLDPETRLALCMWVMDLGLAAKLAARAIRGQLEVCG
jgi:hypothetical protein